MQVCKKPYCSWSFMQLLHTRLLQNTQVRYCMDNMVKTTHKMQWEHTPFSLKEYSTRDHVSWWFEDQGQVTDWLFPQGAAKRKTCHFSLHYRDQMSIKVQFTQTRQLRHSLLIVMTVNETSQANKIYCLPFLLLGCMQCDNLCCTF